MLARGADPRACQLLSSYMIDHLARHERVRYWTGLRALLVSAQAADDERLLGNPFLQLAALLTVPPTAAGSTSVQGSQAQDGVQSQQGTNTTWRTLRVG